jgi:prolipoprotein diacylglyceryl transferase
MDPVAFEIFGIKIRWYGIFIATAFFLGTLLASKEAKRRGINEEEIIDLALFAIPAALIGARAYYVIFTWDMYKHNPIEIFNIRGGGLAIHGGVIAGVLVGLIFCKFRKHNFWTFADITAPSIILGQAIGRWGNYTNQEAFGGPTDLPWGIMIDGVKVHPTFLYESIWNFLSFIFLVWFSRKKSQVEGEVFLLYVILYSLARFFIEGLRTDSLMWGDFRVAQIVSVVSILLAALVLYRRKKALSK